MMTYKLVVFGDACAGKTALIIRLCLNQYFGIYDPGFDDSYRKQVVIDDQPCVLEISDTAGQDEFKQLRDLWIEDGEGFLLVYSIACRNTFDRIEGIGKQIFRVKNADDVPLMLVGSQCDKETEREVTREEGTTLARQLGCEFIETSAKTCVNVERPFYQVVKLIRAQRESLKSTMTTTGGQKKERKNKKACLIL